MAQLGDELLYDWKITVGIMKIIISYFAASFQKNENWKILQCPYSEQNSLQIAKLFCVPEACRAGDITAERKMFMTADCHETHRHTD